MKRMLLCIFLAICSLLFAGCAKQNKDSLENMNLQIVIDETGTEKIVIPDPTEEEKNKKVVLPYLESLNDIEELSMVDLSFCDLKNAKILGYDIGNMVDAQTSLIHVQHNFSDDFQDKVKMSEVAEKQVLGNCLVLFVSVQEKSVDEENYTVVKEDNYIVVLDYINGEKYIIKTVINSYGRLPQLYIADVTNDGLDDIITTNHRGVRWSGMVCEVFSFHSNTLNSIYKSEEIDEEDVKLTRISYFLGQLEDDYKVVIEASSVGFQQSASLLDIGYQSKELEARKILRDPSNPNLFETLYEDSCRVYENRKLLDSVNPTLYISSLDEENGLQIIKSINKSEKKML